MDGHMHDIGIADKSDDIWDCVSDLLTRPDAVGKPPVVGLPSVRELRSLVVIEDRRAAARLVWRQFGSGGPRRSVQAGAVAVLIVTGLAPKIPALRLVVPAARPGLGYHDWLRQALPAEARVGAVLLGPPRANRKPVVLLTSDRGRLMAVAKFGVNKVTRPLVRHEAVALQAVGDAELVEQLVLATDADRRVVVAADASDGGPGTMQTRQRVVEQTDGTGGGNGPVVEVSRDQDQVDRFLDHQSDDAIHGFGLLVEQRGAMETTA